MEPLRSLWEGLTPTWRIAIPAGVLGFVILLALGRTSAGIGWVVFVALLSIFIESRKGGRSEVLKEALPTPTRQPAHAGRILPRQVRLGLPPGEVLELVGEDKLQQAFLRLTGGRTEKGHYLAVIAALIPLESRQPQGNVVKVMVQDELVGEFSSRDAQAYGPVLLALARAGFPLTCEALITGGSDPNRTRPRGLRVTWDRSRRNKTPFRLTVHLAAPERLAELLEAGAEEIPANRG